MCSHIFLYFEFVSKITGNAKNINSELRTVIRANPANVRGEFSKKLRIANKMKTIPIIKPI